MASSHTRFSGQPTKGASGCDKSTSFPGTEGRCGGEEDCCSWSGGGCFVLDEEDEEDEEDEDGADEDASEDASEDDSEKGSDDGDDDDDDDFDFDSNQSTEG